MAAVEGVNFVEPVGTVVAEQVFGEMEPHAALVELGGFALVAVALAGQDDEVEVFACLNQGVRHAERVAGVDVVVHVARHEQEVALEVACQLGVGFDFALEGALLAVAVHGVFDGVFLLPDAVVGLPPPLVVHVVVVVAGGGDSCRVEVRIGTQCRRGHEAAAGVPEDAKEAQ